MPKKDLMPLIDAAKSQNWNVRLTKGKSCHYVFENPNGQTKVFCPSNPGDVRSLLNVKAKLRRAGLKI